MKSKVLFLLSVVLVLGACQNKEKDNRYLITRDRVGKLTKETRVNQLDSLFTEDSIVDKNTSQRFSNGNEIVIYKKGGGKLLRLQPAKGFDKSSTIRTVEVIDTIFQTEEGFGRGSTFNVLKSNYNISRIENTGGTATIFVDEMNIYLSIDKKNMQGNTAIGEKIKTSQINDNAPIKHLWLDWH